MVEATTTKETPAVPPESAPAALPASEPASLPKLEAPAAEEVAPPSPTWRPPSRHVIVSGLIVAAAIAAVLAILMAWHLPPFTSSIEVTENAYVRGRTTVIAPQVSGYVTEVLVADYAQVERGQILARVDDRIYRARVDQARANLEAALASLANSQQARVSKSAGLNSQASGLVGAKAQMLRAKADMARADELVRDGSISKKEWDQTFAALVQAKAQVGQAEAANAIAREDIRSVDVGRGGLSAQVDAARAQLRLAEIDLANTVIRAPEAGQVGEIGVRLGQYVTNGTQLLSLVPAERWVIANYKESQAARMVVGQRAVFTVDALAGARVNGVVQRVSPATGSEFSALKPDNATGNFTKIPQRIGVRIAIDPGQTIAQRLRPGMSVQARVDTASR